MFFSPTKCSERQEKYTVFHKKQPLCFLNYIFAKLWTIFVKIIQSVYVYYYYVRRCTVLYFLLCLDLTLNSWLQRIYNVCAKVLIVEESIFSHVQT